MTDKAPQMKPKTRPTYVGLKLALAASSLVASLLGARLLARTGDVSTQQATQAQAGQRVVIERRYVEVGSGNQTGSSTSVMTLPPIPTAIPYVPAPAPVTSTRSS